MMKSIALLPRKVGTARTFFCDYYENNHAPLAIGLFPFKKYVRNHLPMNDETDIGFDTISEFWTEDIGQIVELMKGPTGDRMRADEINFMHQATIRSGGAEEYLLYGPPRGIDHGINKTALLLKRTGGDDFIAGLKRWAATTKAARVSVDLVTPWNEGWPCDVVVWLWGGSISAPPPGATLWRTLPVAARETSPDERA